MELLKDHVVLVTGGGSGLGLGVARHCRADGAQVAIFEVAADKVRLLREEFGPEALIVHGDVTRTEDLLACRDAIVQRFGVDSMRLYEMFMGPLEATKPWSTSSIQGVRRFLERVWSLAQRPRTGAAPDVALLRLVHRTVRKVTQDIEGLRFNTAISALMVLANETAERETVPVAALEALALLLHPFAPHLAEEVWESLGHPPSIQQVPWPAFDPALCEEDELEIPVQVNGKLRGRVRVPVGAPEADVLAAARAEPRVAAQLEGKQVVKSVYVPGKIVTLVVK